MDVVVAVFDVDGTLTVRDCVVPFTRRIAGIGGLVSGVGKRLPTVVSTLVRRDRDAVKTLFVDLAFAGKRVADVEEEGVVFADHVFHSWMRLDVARRFRWHQEQGHVVVLVSASLEPYLLPLGDLLEADAVLCTGLEHIDGVYTGKLRGRNCRGAEKVARLSQWCTESGVPMSSIQFAYGDSTGDADMLKIAAHSFYVADLEIEEAPT
jgi:phosphatidylglycerophosphatase C